jgi:ATP-independent RNA helicase DbpA
MIAYAINLPVVINSMKSFSTLELRDALLNNLKTLEFVEMTPIQEHSLPLLLQGQDVIAQAKTGSGKTVAFGLTVLNRLDIDNYAVQALVLCPTRELADQVSQALRQLARQLPNIKILNLSGGMPMRAQMESLRHAAHIIVGTPGRVLKHLEKETLSLRHLQTLVLDEADRMLDLGFYDEMDAIIRLCPTKRQTLLFSATYPSGIQKLASKFLQKPKKVVVEDQDEALDIQQIFYRVEAPKEKYQLLKKLLHHHQSASVLIFCNTKEQTAQLAASLTKDGFSAMALHGDMEQFDRDTAIIQFKNNSCSILVATDVAARGLDIKELPLVINFDLAFEHDAHIHRIGRTGRAGNKGLAISLSIPADAQRLSLIEETLAQPLAWGVSNELSTVNKKITSPEMVTLFLSAGKKDKIRPGDILGSLTKDAGLAGDTIGKIDIFPTYSYVAVQRKHVDAAFQHLKQGKLKSRKFNTKKLS